jgi:maltose alpha-D-glucosyltransferase/alpha-amylase
MGDNIWLGDRDGVRTPMQWTPDRNAGFSTATPGRLCLPVNQDPVYGYQAINVEAQRDNSASLLNWTRTMLAVRRRHVSFAVGDFQDLGGSNPSVLAFLRMHEDDVVLCVHNLSRFPQPIELSLPSWAGYTPIELTGRVTFPRVGHLPYLLTLPGYAFYWLQLCAPGDES